METGIVRRMDELGRVVIPKELRKTMRLSEGTPLEIYREKDSLIIKKYSPVFTINTEAEKIAISLNEITGKTAVITDNDTVIFSTRGKFKEIIGEKISFTLDKVLKERKSVVINTSTGGTIVPITDNKEITFLNQIIVPIIANGDCFGSVILIDSENKEVFNINDVKLVRLSSSFLSRQID